MSAPRTAVITGASGAIGAAIAETLAAEGYRVFVDYRNGRDSADSVVKRITGSGGWAVASKPTSRIAAKWTALSPKSNAQCGAVDYLVNNAAITRDALLPFLSDEQWDEVIDTNLRGTYLCSQLALSGMMRLGCGSICNIVSPSGIRGQAGQCNYSASKKVASSRSRRRSPRSRAVRYSRQCRFARGSSRRRCPTNISRKRSAVCWTAFRWGASGVPRKLLHWLRFWVGRRQATSPGR